MASLSVPRWELSLFRIAYSVFRGCVVSLRLECGSPRALTFTRRHRGGLSLHFPHWILVQTNLDLVAQIFAWHVHKRKCRRQLKANSVGGFSCHFPRRFSHLNCACISSCPIPYLAGELANRLNLFKCFYRPAITSLSKRRRLIWRHFFLTGFL